MTALRMLTRASTTSYDCGNPVGDCYFQSGTTLAVGPPADAPNNGYWYGDGSTNTCDGNCVIAPSGNGDHNMLAIAPGMGFPAVRQDIPTIDYSTTQGHRDVTISAWVWFNGGGVAGLSTKHDWCEINAKQGAGWYHLNCWYLPDQMYQNEQISLWARSSNPNGEAVFYEPCLQVWGGAFSCGDWSSPAGAQNCRGGLQDTNGFTAQTMDNSYIDAECIGGSAPVSMTMPLSYGCSNTVYDCYFRSGSSLAVEPPAGAPNNGYWYSDASNPCDGNCVIAPSGNGDHNMLAIAPGMGSPVVHQDLPSIDYSFTQGHRDVTISAWVWFNGGGVAGLSTKHDSCEINAQQGAGWYHLNCWYLPDQMYQNEQISLWARSSNPKAEAVFYEPCLGLWGGGYSCGDNSTPAGAQNCRGGLQDTNGFLAQTMANSYIDAECIGGTVPVSMTMPVSFGCSNPVEDCYFQSGTIFSSGGSAGSPNNHYWYAGGQSNPANDCTSCAVVLSGAATKSYAMIAPSSSANESLTQQIAIDYSFTQGHRDVTLSAWVYWDGRGHGQAGIASDHDSCGITGAQGAGWYHLTCWYLPSTMYTSEHFVLWAGASIPNAHALFYNPCVQVWGGTYSCSDWSSPPDAANCVGGLRDTNGFSAQTTDNSYIDAECIGGPPPPEVPAAASTVANTLGGSNSNVTSTTCHRKLVANANDPVDCATGDFYNTFTDLSVPGRGLPLDFNRTYNSLSAGQDSPLGYGWADSYNAYLSTDASGVITATEGNGSSVTFSPDGQGGYTAPGRVLATLAQNSNGTFILTSDKDQQQLVFTTPTTTTTGLLLDQIDRNGYTTALTYTNGLLSKVTDPAGRSLTFTYSGTHIASVADPIGRTVAYTYDAVGNLTAVQDVGGNVTHYGYDQDTHLLRTITDPNGNVLAMVYDPVGRVTAVTDPLGHTATMTYTANANGSQTTTMTDTRGIVTQEQYLNNELLSETKGVGTPQQATWTYAYDPVTLGLTSETDPDGHTTYNTYDSRGNRLSHTDALGRTTSYTYDQLNDLTTVTDPLSVTTVMTYDASGNLLQTSRPLTQTGLVATTTLSYDAKHPGDVIAKTDPNGHTWHYTYDAYGDRTSATDPAGDTTTATFDQIGRKTSVTDPRGNVAGADPSSYTTTMAYNALGQTTAITDPLGHVTTYQYDADQNLITATDPLGHQTVYDYDGNNHRTSVTRPDGSLLTTGYDAAGNVITQTDALGHSTLTSYDALGRVASVTDPLGRVTTYQDDPAGNVITTTDPLGHQTIDGYDAANELTSVRHADGGVDQTVYDADGRVIRRIDPLQHATAYSYDSLGRLISVSDPLSRTTTYSYDLVGNRTAVTDPLGRVTTYQYDAADQLITTTDALSGTTITGYDPAGEVITRTDALGHVTAYGYDADGERTSLTRPDGGVLRTNYDADGNVITQTNAMGRQTVSAYDLLNRRISVSDPQGAVTAYDYDADGHVITTTDALGQQTVASYDAAGERTRVTQADGSHLTISYDADGNVITQTNALGQPTVYGYDALNRVASVTDPLGRTTTYRYDLAGNRVGLTDPLSRTTTYGYDADHELTSITYSDRTTPHVAYTYTATGQRASMTDGTGTTTYGYDALDRVITTTNGAGQTLGYGYDAVGNLTRLTYPDGSQVTRSYDTLDRLSSVTDWLGHTSTFGYDPDSNPITATLPTTSDATGISQGYNAADQLTAITATQGSATLWSASYGRDPLGQVITGTDSLDGQDHTYTYNPLDQLTADQAVSGTSAITQTWSPDSAYELTARTDASGVTAHSYGYDTASEVLTDTVGLSGTTTTYGYDRAGNRVSQQDSAAGSSTSYGYDQAARLVSAVISDTMGITSASYAYDGDGLRASKTVTDTGGITTTAETWDTSGALPLLVQEGSTRYLTGPDGLPLEQIDGSGHVRYYLHDQMGSTRMLLDGAGVTQATYTYDAYGNIVQRTGSMVTSFGFAGQYTDAETGLQYLHARYYDLATGQFLSVDPLVDETNQPYAYTGNDPLNATDPTGLFCIPFVTPGGCRLPTWGEARREGYGTAVSASAVLDSMTFGAFSHLANWAGAGVDTCSTDYKTGEKAALPINLLLAMGSLGSDADADAVVAASIARSSGEDATVAGDAATILERGGRPLYGGVERGPYTPSGTVIGQESRDTCTATSCLMLIRDADTEGNARLLNQSNVAEILNTTQRGASIARVPAALERIADMTGMDAVRGYTYREGMSLSDLEGAVAGGKPAIVSMEVPSAGGAKALHAVVVDGIQDGHVLIRDPSPGGSLGGEAYSVPVEGFLADWQGRAVVAP